MMCSQPSNILVDQNGTVKLADFGSSRLISSSTCINNESMRGTPNYMAPEVVRQTTRSRKADIWSVGCTVLRLLTGLPFWGDKKFDSQMSLLYYIAQLSELPPLPGTLSDDARSFITSCLEIDANRRPTAEELLLHPFVQTPSPRSPTRDTRSHTAPAELVTPLKLVVEPLPAISQQPPVPPVTAPAKSPHRKSERLAPLFPSPRLDLPVRLVCLTLSMKRELTINVDQMRPDGDDENEKSIPSMSVSFPVSSRTRVSPIDRGDNYTYTDFTEPATAPAKLSARQRPIWEEQPILTDVARLERERADAFAVESKRKREERDRKYQEELAAFRTAQLQS